MQKNVKKNIYKKTLNVKGHMHLIWERGLLQEKEGP
jgi:hypothetical protein